MNYSTTPLTGTPNQDVFITEATVDDVPAIIMMVDAAYSKYIDRMGKRPAPMDEDYYSVVQTSPTFVFKEDGITIGAIMISCDNEANSVMINNLVVDPAAQGRGLGRVLMNYAESFAISRGISTLKLYTNIKMYENIQLYGKMGFSEDGRKTEDGFERVYFCKKLTVDQTLNN